MLSAIALTIVAGLAVNLAAAVLYPWLRRWATTRARRLTVMFGSLGVATVVVLASDLIGRIIIVPAQIEVVWPPPIFMLGSVWTVPTVLSFFCMVILLKASAEANGRDLMKAMIVYNELLSAALLLVLTVTTTHVGALLTNGSQTRMESSSQLFFTGLLLLGGVLMTYIFCVFCYRSFVLRRQVAAALVVTNTLAVTMLYFVFETLNRTLAKMVISIH